MLRLLIAVLLCVWHTAEAETRMPEPNEIAEQRNLADKALRDAQQVANTQKFLVDIERNRASLNAMTAGNADEFYALPESVLSGDNTAVDDILKARQPPGAVTAQPGIRSPVMLVSFSMPKEKIIALIEEADRVGALVVLRGLVDDDLNATLKTLNEYAQGHPSGGIVIDPTLFDRFEMHAVPAFVLPLEPILPCDASGCKVPAHVAAKGSASLHYFLDLVARTGNGAEKQAAGVWLAKYRESP